MYIKICANTNLADAQLAAELGADAVGFVFAPSKRQVTAEQVAAITPHLPERVAAIGVFATQDAREIVAAARTAGLKGVQLHHAPNPVLVEDLNREFAGRVQLIQVVPYRIDAEADAQFEAELRAAMAMTAISAVLVDAARGGVSGGLGAAFDWSAAATILRRVSASMESELPKLIVAGGLRAENVVEAIRALQPWGVDVASGVESEPGTKDPERLRGFLAAVRGVPPPPLSVFR